MIGKERNKSCETKDVCTIFSHTSILYVPTKFLICETPCVYLTNYELVYIKIFICENNTPHKRLSTPRGITSLYAFKTSHREYLPNHSIISAIIPYVWGTPFLFENSHLEKRKKFIRPTTPNLLVHEKCLLWLVWWRNELCKTPISKIVSHRFAHKYFNAVRQNAYL